MNENLQNPQQPVPETKTRPGLLKTMLNYAAWGAGIEAVFRVFTKAEPLVKLREIGRTALSWAAFGGVIHLGSTVFGLNEDKNKGNFGRHVVAGGTIGATAIVVDNIIEKRPFSGKLVAIFAAVGATLYGVVSLFQKKPTANKVAANTNGPASTTPPAIPAQPIERTLAISEVPQILDILVAQNQLTTDQQTQVLNDIKGGRKGFAGQIAIENGFIKPEQLENALLAQSNQKTAAAISDIQGLSQEHGAYRSPLWLKANWGNNGVNPASAHPTRADGASAAANNAQNLVMLAYANPHREILPIVQQGIIAAANLTRGIAQGNSAHVPLAKMADSWREEMDNALLVASQANPQAMVDAKGNPVDVHAFIAARNTEINAAVQQALQQTPPHKDSGLAR